MADADAILRLEGVVKQFGGVRAVDGATFDVGRGSITALIGPNGAGKTTLFNVVTGFERGERGAIVFDGASIARKPPHAIAKRRMVRTFQLTKALAAMPVIDNMMLAAPHQPGEQVPWLVVRPRAARRRERAIRARAEELLEAFGLAAKRDDYAGTLSGGQRKLLELARALMTEPRMVLLDEPMAGVNPTLGRRLLQHVHELRNRAGTTFLFVEHDMDVVMGHADRVVVMAQGAVIAAGDPEAIQADQRVVRAYLGGGSA